MDRSIPSPSSNKRARSGEARERTVGNDHDSQIRHAGNIQLAQLTGPVILHEMHFLCGTFRRPPLPDPPLQSPQLPVGELLRILPLQCRQATSLPPNQR
jgi:hypothetical protein